MNVVTIDVFTKMFSFDWIQIVGTVAPGLKVRVNCCIKSIKIVCVFVISMIKTYSLTNRHYSIVNLRLLFPRLEHHDLFDTKDVEKNLAQVLFIYMRHNYKLKII